MTYIWLNRAGKTTPQALMIRSAFVVLFTTLSVTLTHLPTAGASAQNTCPSQDPDKFINLYSESLLLQKTFITFPLKYTFYDDDEDKGMLKKTTMIKKYLDIPWLGGKDGLIFTDRKSRLKMGLRIKVEKKGDQMNVRLFKPDTDGITIYHFKRSKDCWSLYWINSLSP